MPLKSSAPALECQPSSNRLLSVVRHVDKTKSGPGLAKTTLISRTSVQPGEVFRRHRERLGWTQSKAAARYGVHRRTVINWEAGGRMPAEALLWIQGVM